MTPATPEVLRALAALFSYPDNEYTSRAERAQALAAENTGEILRTFIDAIQAVNLSRLQELYIQTFDMNPDGALDIGWHLFGEDYARGDFLVKLRHENQLYGIDEAGELPDNLTVVLQLLSKLPALEGEEFARKFITPALEKIRAGIKAIDNPFALLVDSLILAVEAPSLETAVAGEVLHD